MGYHKSTEDDARDSFLTTVKHFGLLSLFITVFFAVLTVVLFEFVYVLNAFPKSEFMAYILWGIDFIPVIAGVMTFIFGWKTIKAFLLHRNM